MGFEAVFRPITERMAEVVPTALAVLAVLFIALALLLLTGGDMMLAGMSFLGASLLIYFRETHFVAE